jgi:hypothetical protein
MLLEPIAFAGGNDEPAEGMTVALSDAQARTIWRSIRVRLYAMMDKATHVWWKFGCNRTRKQHSHA